MRGKRFLGRIMATAIILGGILIGHNGLLSAQESDDLTNLKVISGYGDAMVMEITTNAENQEDKTTENTISLFDNNPETKWFTGKDFGKTATIIWRYHRDVAVSQYSFVSANDADYRDPQHWILYGSTDGQNFEILDEQTENSFEERFQTKTYEIASEKQGSYSYYKVEFIANQKGRNDCFQMSDILLDGIVGTEPITEDISSPAPTSTPTPTELPRTIINDIQTGQNNDIVTVNKGSTNKIGKCKVLSKKKVGKKKYRIKLSKATNAKTYEIRYKIGKKGKYHTIKVSGKRVKTINLKPGKTYYMQVRGVATNDTKKVTGPWSKRISIKMK